MTRSLEDPPLTVLTDEALTDIEAIVAAATPGPWAVSGHEDDPRGFMLGCFDFRAEEKRLWLLICGYDNPDRAVIPAITGNGPTSEANAVFISAASEAMPLLLAEVRKSRIRDKEAEHVQSAFRQGLADLVSATEPKASTDATGTRWERCSICGAESMDLIPHEAGCAWDAARAMVEAYP